MGSTVLVYCIDLTTLSPKNKQRLVGRNIFYVLCKFFMLLLKISFLFGCSDGW